MTTLITTLTDTRTPDQRWADWIMRGAARDRIAKRRAVSVAIAIACAFTLWLAMLLTRG